MNSPQTLYRYQTVTRCVGCVSPNTRPHQLRWGDRECGYYTSYACTCTYMYLQPTAPVLKAEHPGSCFLVFPFCMLCLFVFYVYLRFFLFFFLTFLLLGCYAHVFPCHRPALAGGWPWLFTLVSCGGVGNLQLRLHLSE